MAGGGKGKVRSPVSEVVNRNRFTVLATQLREEDEVVIEVGGGEGNKTPKAKVVKRTRGARR